MEFVKDKVTDAVQEESTELEKLFNTDINFNELLNFDDFDVFTQKVPLFITLIEKTIKNTLVKNKGSIPNEIAALYCSYILMALSKVDEITSKVTYFSKKSEADAKFTMASEKTKAIVTKDSDAGRESWVLSSSDVYKEKISNQHQLYAVLKFFEAKQTSLDKIYYLCKSFVNSSTGLV